MTSASPAALLIENEQGWEDRLVAVLQEAGINRVITLKTYREAERELQKLDLLQFAIAIIDIRLREPIFDQGGLALLDLVKSRRPGLPVLMLSAYFDDYPGLERITRRYKKVTTCEKEIFLSSPRAILDALLHGDPTTSNATTITRAFPNVIAPGFVLKDRYVIEKELGHGAMGITYLARDRKLFAKRVVVKVLKEKSEQNSLRRRRFGQEIEALSRIEHSGVVGVFDADEMPDGKPYLVMQFVEGATLRSLLKVEGVEGMEFSRVAAIVRQIGEALNAAHHQGVWHRDLKPENIMVKGFEEEVILIDFGLAKVRDSLAATGTDPTSFAGTIPYMAPEQLQRKPSAASDIYAFGVIAYEMITGRRPFSPESPLQLLEMQREGVRIKPRDLRPGLPEAAQDVILKALCFDPTNRYAQARDLGEALSKALILEVIAAPDTHQSVRLQIAHVLYVDLVGCAKLPLDQQAQLLGKLQEIVSGTPEFCTAQRSGRLIPHPAADGYGLVFLVDPVAPVRCAAEISHSLLSYPGLKLRMGIHSGPVHSVSDSSTSFNKNVIGSGINLAQYVMECGDADHILLSQAVAQILSQLGTWAESLHDLGEHEVKPGERVHLFNLYTNELGNPKWPEKLAHVTEGTELIDRIVFLEKFSSREIGLRVWVEKEEVVQTRDFLPDQAEPPLSFRLGDRVAICACAAQDCFMWIISVGTTGRSAIVFPQTTGEGNRVAAGEVVRVPGTLTGRPGQETVFAFVSKTPLPSTISSDSKASFVGPTVDEVVREGEAAIRRSKLDCASATIRFAIQR